jgi:hypothetical protein
VGACAPTHFLAFPQELFRVNQIIYSFIWKYAILQLFFLNDR